MGLVTWEVVRPSQYDLPTKTIVLAGMYSVLHRIPDSMLRPAVLIEHWLLVVSVFYYAWPFVCELPTGMEGPFLGSAHYRL